MDGPPKPALKRKKADKQGTTAPAAAKPVPVKGLFTKDLAQMMYGFGDDSRPYADSIALVEDCLVDFLSSASREAARITVAKDGRPKPEDLLHVVRKNPRMHTRAKNLLLLDKEFKKTVKPGFDDD